ncbi:MAG: hypothetical protein EOT05_00410 [Candidatus Microsaccharimonas sossegonensis]|uniref:WxL domain-containing protein n=1 Tax=Candidatus Microsaccharimonas sossegonensis TaxID=2506948 RepID=A0A4Q0AGY3_9BACT|nr:MAG: hypothetical protein EOT05_00410 [Candidatus Microsaccharimonas sossegonensis]
MMKIISIKNLSPIKASLHNRFIIIASIFALITAPLLGVFTTANAAQITGRSVTLSSSAPSATGVTYTLSTAALPTTTAVKSMQIQFCTTASGSCTTPAGFSSSSSTLASQPTGLGATTGWTVNAATAGSLRIVNASNATTSSGAVSVSWNGVANPSATNTTFYGIITTYSDSAWTTAIDSGTVALSTATQIQVALTVGEALTFCAGTSITGQNCGTISGSTVSLGNASTTATASGTSVLAASTNASNGYSITVNGTTLTSGSNTITALAGGATSSVGTKQFGINLVGNTTPAVGSAVSGSGTGAAATNYGTANTFRFGSGETVATVGAPTNANTYTVSYIANIDGVTPPGAYTSNLTYVATANY